MSNADHSHDTHTQHASGSGIWTIMLIMIVPSALTLGWVIYQSASGQ
ncbi:hypothetical protein BCM14_2722 [Jezberella montanilacus]|jgi:hypothetical protein|uniref:Uncharacterized protein n=1 Tax=Jezberella montanilacus TaxID=323426 RepID=A0A2T0XC28_9BURK|nr:hypothetical protein [Jezberella montanilacus]PRY96482.1 hypothetical protein BCM14_2722 [Jezberella montanilacus]